ncbi:DUF1294 domain-containing protein [Alishewanella tabrizica]|uniref:DNA-binding protein n=1 Tax=Alishewanella tabrizica TaxID=671278 RepID=A0ABQ2WFK5_9ALTE|nr:cold shock and DUF1294 domain-containing protein [Alishewanella tabrizica]GGW49847.1 DNA-binding protein [Alishewanella tabrizica]
MRLKGKITQWDDVKGFGFIQPMLNGDRVFLHIKTLQNRQRRPMIGDVVTYSVTQDKSGRSQADSVTFAGETLRVKAAKKGGFWPIALLLIFLAGLLMAVVTQRMPVFVLLAYLLLSVVTFVVYWFDKRKAQTGNWRTPESTLQFCSLIGGWPGALLAQHYLRHKSQKRSFLWQFWSTVLLNVALLLYFYSRDFISLS